MPGFPEEENDPSALGGAMLPLVWLLLSALLAPLAPTAPAPVADPLPADVPAGHEGDADDARPRIRASIRNTGDTSATALLRVERDGASAPMFLAPVTIAPRTTTNWTFGVPPGKYDVSLQAALLSASTTLHTGDCPKGISTGAFTLATGPTRFVIGVDGKHCAANDRDRVNVDGVGTG